MSVYDTNVPGAFGAGGYADASLAANTAYKNALARINQKRSGTLRQYGYQGDIDPTTGVLQNVRVDANNPYGGLQSMLRQHAHDFQQADYAAEERGLHGGLAHKQYSDLAHDHGAQSAQFGQGFVDAFGQLQDDQNSAAYDRDKAMYDAELEQARLAIEQQAFDPGDYTGLDYPAYGEDPVPTLDQPSAKARTVAAKVISNATKKAVATSKVAKASSAAKTVAKAAGQSQAQQALAARSAGLNAKYGLGTKKKGGK